jgi:hypothetical protein
MELAVTDLDVVRARTRYALEHQAPLVVDWRLARDRAYLDAHDVHIIDWTAIPHASADDARWDEPHRARRRRGRRPPRGSSSGTKGARYVAALVAGEYDAVARAEVGTRNNVLARAAFRYGQAAATGLLDEADAVALLEQGARASGLPDRETRSTIRSGIRAGRARPLEVPK